MDIPISRIKSLNLKPEDILVLECPDFLEADQVVVLKKQINAFCDNKVIVLEGGMTIKAMVIKGFV